MDPLTGLGAAAAVAELLGVCIKSAKAANDVYRAFKDAPTQLQQLIMKLELVKCHIQQIQCFGEELSDVDMEDLFPVSYRDMLLTALRVPVAALEELKSLADQQASSTTRSKLAWAVLEKRKARSILGDISAALEIVNTSATILGV